MIDKLRSWKEQCNIIYADDSDFGIENLPFGIFRSGSSPQIGIRIGDEIVDLEALSQLSEFPPFRTQTFLLDTVNPIIQQGNEFANSIRHWCRDWLISKGSTFSDLADRVLRPINEVEVLMPLEVRGYTDFYASRYHAENVGSLFRPNQAPLLENWMHMPIAYHGRTSTIFGSGKEIRRPKGQILDKESNRPYHGFSRKLDFELEMAAVIGKPVKDGRPISLSEAKDHIFGYVLLNDWSARDIQSWEYRPLGPFLGKNFASTISPWIVSAEALEYFKVSAPIREKELLGYLREEKSEVFDIDLFVDLKGAGSRPTPVTFSNSKYIYWTWEQMLVHHTSGGCVMETGDLLGSGTISGPRREEMGSLLEITHDGRNLLVLNDEERRTFLEDGDEVTLRGRATKDGCRVGFGSLVNKIAKNK